MLAVKEPVGLVRGDSKRQDSSTMGQMEIDVVRHHISIHTNYAYLRERKKTLKKRWCRHEFQSFRPWRLRARLLWVDSDRVEMPLKQK